MNRCKMQNTQKSVASSSSVGKAKKKVIPKKVMPKAAPKKVVLHKDKHKAPATVTSGATTLVPPKATVSKIKARPKFGGHKKDGAIAELMRAELTGEFTVLDKAITQARAALVEEARTGAQSRIV